MRSIQKSAVAIALLLSFGNGIYCQDEIKIWNEFLNLVRTDRLTEDKVKPLPELGNSFPPILLGFLDSVRSQAAPGDWMTVPEIIKVENRIQFIVPWSTHGQKVSYCFSFILENSQWFFQHLEAIFIRLDNLPLLPVSEFPDVSEQQKAWAREEIYWSFVVLNMYLPIKEKLGEEYALNLLRDGMGYFVGAKTWVPFVPPHKAFILYLCWEQANLRGNSVTLEKLTDSQALIQLEIQFFYLYFNAAHLKPKISFEDYKQIFETIWQDRAKHAGWKLDINYSSDNKVVFSFNREP